MNKARGIAYGVVMAFSLFLAVLWQVLFAQEINYYIVSVGVLVLSMLPFFMGFEMKKITAREITLVATFIALAVVSRALFYLVPQFKPIAAVVIASAVCVGSGRGYIVGAFSAFISNFIFGQGFWTPFQMVALGLIGFVSGALFKKISVNRVSLSVVGFILAFVLYGLIVDMSTVISVYGSSLNIKGVLSVYLAGLPFSLTFGAATAVFLFFFGEIFIKKIKRIMIKYNILS